jgi:hypothetical protein
MSFAFFAAKFSLLPLALWVIWSAIFDRPSSILNSLSSTLDTSIADFAYVRVVPRWLAKKPGCRWTSGASNLIQGVAN